MINGDSFVTQVLQSALVTFDLMESIIFRIEEIIKEKEEHQQ